MVRIDELAPGTTLFWKETIGNQTLDAPIEIVARPADNPYDSNCVLCCRKEVTGAGTNGIECVPYCAELIDQRQRCTYGGSSLDRAMNAYGHRVRYMNNYIQSVVFKATEHYVEGEAGLTRKKSIRRKFFAPSKEDLTMVPYLTVRGHRAHAYDDGRQRPCWEGNSKNWWLRDGLISQDAYFVSKSGAVGVTDISMELTIVPFFCLKASTPVGNEHGRYTLLPQETIDLESAPIPPNVPGAGLPY